MVGVAQLVELRLVMPAVVGSSPIVHPICLTDWIGFFFVIPAAWTLFVNSRPDYGLFRVRVDVYRARVGRQ